LTAYSDSMGPFLLAHRGGALESLPNTLESFQHAHDAGYIFLETDVWLANGELYLSHDRPIAGLKYTTLSKLFDALPDCYFAIDPKHDAAVAPLAELIVAKRRVGQVCIGASFDGRAKRTADSIEKMCGERPATALVSALASIMLVTNSARQLVRYQDNLQASFIHVHKSLVTPRTIQIAHRHGLKIIAWTVNDSTLMNKMLGWGVDGFMTDNLAEGSAHLAP